MKPVQHQMVIQANSPKLLAEEVARFTEAGWCTHGEPVALLPDEIGRPIYWTQTIDLVREVAQLPTPSVQRRTWSAGKSIAPLGKLGTPSPSRG